jgi:Fe2+ transport system protein FeoA
MSIVQRLFRWPRQAARRDDVRRLSEAPSGSRFQVAGLEAGNDETVQKIILIGALPGSSVEVIQRFPAFLVAFGNSQFAIDRELAEKIVVQPLGQEFQVGSLPRH